MSGSGHAERRWGQVSRPAPTTVLGPRSPEALQNLAESGSSRRAVRRTRRNAAARRSYARAATISGPLDRSADQRVRFRRVASAGQLVMLTALVLLNMATAAAFIGWLLLPGHVPGYGHATFGGWRLNVARVSFCV